MKVRELRIDSPLAVYLPRKTVKDKRIAINLNIYRNLNFMVNNEAKKVYKQLVLGQIKGKQIETPVNITYRVYKASKRHLDKGNVIAVTQKFLLDALTEENVWTDDNDEFVKTEVMLPTRLDRANPRCEIVITTIDISQRLLLNLNEIDDEETIIRKGGKSVKSKRL
jgi:Holliday junction resolvase RusA-like endonuclease